MDTLRDRALLALLPATVLLCLPQLTTFQLGKAVLAGPLLAMLLVRGRGPAQRPRGAIPVAAALVVLAGLAAAFRSPAPGTAAWELWLDLLFLAAVLAAASLRDAAAHLPAAVLAAGLAAVGVAGLEAIGFRLPCPAAVARGGTMGNPNFAGAVIGLAAPVALCGVFGAGSPQAARRLRRALAATSLAVLLATLVWLESWTGAVAAAVGMLAAGGLALAGAGRPRVAAALVLGVLAAAGCVLVAGVGLDHLEARAYMARVSLDAAAARPLFGHGLGGFPRAFLDAQAAALDAAPADRGLWTLALHAHSEPLHALVERGLPGILAWIVLWVAVAREVGPSRHVLAGILAAGFALHLGEFPGHLVPVQLGLGYAAGSLAGSAPAPRSAPLRLAAVPILACLFMIPPWLAASDLFLVRGDPAAALALNPWNGSAAFAVGLAEQDGDAPTGCTHAALAVDLAPSPAAALALGLCRARTGDRRAGLEEIRRAARWNPRNAAAHANLAVLLLAEGDAEAARSHAKRAMALRPGDPRIVAACRRVLNWNGQVPTP